MSHTQTQQSFPLHENSARLTAIQVSRAEYEHIVAKLKLATELNRNVPAAAIFALMLATAFMFTGKPRNNGQGLINSLE
jgi:hypothetical protein